MLQHTTVVGVLAGFVSGKEGFSLCVFACANTQNNLFLPNATPCSGV